MTQTLKREQQINTNGKFEQETQNIYKGYGEDGAWRRTDGISSSVEQILNSYEFRNTRVGKNAVLLCSSKGSAVCRVSSPGSPSSTLQCFTRNAEGKMLEWLIWHVYLFFTPPSTFTWQEKEEKNRTTLFPELLSPTATQLLAVFIINNYWLLLLLIPQVQDYVHFHYNI